MTKEQAGKAGQIEALLDSPDLANALESEQFKKFLDQVPIAIGVAELRSKELIVYANPEFEKLSALSAAKLLGQPWSVLEGEGLGQQRERSIADAIREDSDCVGSFKLKRIEGEPAIVDAYSNVIENDEGIPCFRLVALVDVTAHQHVDRETLEDRIREKDMLLRELQHRVKNNLQMITTLIRLETRNHVAPDRTSLERLAGRVESLAILYRTLAAAEHKDELDLGIYLSQIAAATMQAHATEGIRLDLKVDTYPVSINVAMPAGLVVNELLTNALKHAFAGRDGGTVTLHSVVNGDGCRVVVADDGIGLPPGESWPKAGKLGALIARSLKENAKAELKVDSNPGQGTRITILFRRSIAASA
ncbi:histidine kinase dimerization/phosphoacceptor domain -containing protein [Mesorhizobium sp. BAC0120]|uniref:sensor histidine kinase n=1 Tax=Mesorhizobium sp. BAC0120 TaxID=3090670 RepID=UPI00298D2BA0|nr:histidine kinase dimerization/phosphoacceptor domain -containing protein [Mesorhizobium sp. BAC0120]MDW6021030.1 histidine kinase dimerization/phosphoacceptor domain -containing protein [Mesorhizobium sp. BAC0120]